MQQAATIIIMAKAPEAGEVKTRLCPPLSPTEAAVLYRCFLLDTIAKVRALKAVRPVMAYAPASSKRFFEGVAPDFTLIPQQGDDLGSRMASCFEQIFAQGYTEVLLTGSDLPTLPTPYLQQAIELITMPHIDVVLGPGEDGGYYLIGLRQLHGELFEEMTWSTNQVLAETIRRAKAKGLKVACVPSWYDIDTPADLERLRISFNEIADSLSSQTQRFLVSLAPRVAGEGSCILSLEN